MIREAPPLSLYAHFPWCVRKCPYCDFNSHRAPQEIPEALYVARLLEDLDYELTFVPDRTLVSIFLGGGTPSLFRPEAIGSFLRGVRARVAVSSSLEVTLEANPGTIERDRFSGYRDAGVTRVSLGAQSFNDAHLHALGRIHSADEIRLAVGELHGAGIANFNIDLMYGLPAQSVGEAVADLREALALNPAHVSHYQLTLEPETAFYRRPPSALPEAEVLWDMQVACQEELASQGYEQYEVSAYARANRECAHNMNYWQFGDYLGVGAGAHGKRTDFQAQRVVRTTRCKQPRQYLARTAVDRVETEEPVAHADLPFEFMLNALRLRSGFSTDLFEARTGLSIDMIVDSLRSAEGKGLLQCRVSGIWTPTELGYRFLNDLQAQFLPAAEPHESHSRPHRLSANVPG